MRPVGKRTKTKELKGLQALKTKEFCGKIKEAERPRPKGKGAGLSG